MRYKILAIASTLSLLFSLSACSAFSEESSPSSTSDTYTIATSFYPITWLTEKIGGSHISVTPLTPPHVEPHEYELSPKEVTELEKTQAVIYASGFQPALDKAIEEAEIPHILDLSTSLDLLPLTMEDHAEDVDHDEHDHGTYDPHFWLDPQYMIDAGSAIATMLENNDPANAEKYRANFENLKSELNALKTDFHQGLQQCQSRILISEHSAFGYVAHTYDLEAMPLSLDSESEPGPARLKDLTSVIREKKIETIFAEEGTHATSTQALAEETGAQVLDISTLERAPETGDYLETMRNNLQRLREGLGCE